MQATGLVFPTQIPLQPCLGLRGQRARGRFLVSAIARLSSRQTVVLRFGSVSDDTVAQAIHIRAQIAGIDFGTSNSAIAVRCKPARMLLLSLKPR